MSIHDTVPVIARAPKPEYLARRLKDLLPMMQGSENARTTKEIMHLMDLKSRGTDSALRTACKLLLSRGTPIVACHAGFFEAIRMSELEAYQDNLDSRIKGMFRTRKHVKQLMKSWTRRQGELFVDLEVE